MDYFNKQYKSLFIIFITILVFSCSIPGIDTDNNVNGVVVGIGNCSGLSRDLANGLNKSFINGDNNAIDKSSIDSDSIFVVDMQTTLTKENNDLLIAANRKNATFVLKNTTNDKMKDFALVTAESDTVIILNNGGGRRQKIIIEGDKDNFIEIDNEGQNKTIFNKEDDQNLKSSNKTIDKKIKMGSNAIISMLKSEIGKKSISRNSFETENINAALARATVIFTQVNWKPWGGSENFYYGSFDIEISATEKPSKKFVKIKSNGTAVGVNKLGKYFYEDYHSFYGNLGFNIYGRIVYYPGSQYTENKTDIHMPSGWRRIHNQPETKNSETTYISTTGWSVTKGVNATIAEASSIGASLSTTYSESKQEIRRLDDFMVVNSSSNAVCDWKYKYTKWFDYYDNSLIDNIVDLASSTVFMSNEAVYEVPKMTSGQHPFVFAIEHGVASAYESRNTSNKKHKDRRDESKMSSHTVNINFDLVRPPGENGLAGTYSNNWPNVAPAFTRHEDRKIDFNWGGAKPDPRITSDKFYVQWDGFMKAPYTGEYTIYTYNDDCINLYFWGKHLINSWYWQAPTEHKTTIYMEKDQYYPIAIEYVSTTGDSVFKLSWEHDSIDKQTIPWQNLYSGRYWE
ncbi:MAG: hypothetical protein GY756_03365 [bacterium]|nr:hypothetical protein [bacterium]